MDRITNAQDRNCQLLYVVSCPPEGQVLVIVNPEQEPVILDPITNAQDCNCQLLYVVSCRPEGQVLFLNPKQEPVILGPITNAQDRNCQLLCVVSCRPEGQVLFEPRTGTCDFGPHHQRSGPEVVSCRPEGQALIVNPEQEPVILDPITNAQD